MITVQQCSLGYCTNRRSEPSIDTVVLREGNGALSRCLHRDSHLRYDYGTVVPDVVSNILAATASMYRTTESLLSCIHDNELLHIPHCIDDAMSMCIVTVEHVLRSSWSSSCI